ncbi:MAG: hypothetical protein PHV93_02470 [Candidatus Pacebacteria bacterium]|nr:hypothetical protein [Candidatus Paceibacterota bacterium]
MKGMLSQNALTFFLSGFILLSLAYMPFLSVSAEIIAPENSVTLSIQPQNPEPNSQVDATLEGYLFDLQKAKISWFLNGALKETGTGKTDFSFTTGDPGKTIILKAVVDASDGTHAEKELSVQAANVDLAWEALSYTPPFYKGKSLFPPQGIVKVVALPDLTDGSGNLIAPEKLVYKWTKDREILGDDSGYGKNMYVFSGDIFARPVTIEVEVSALSGNQTAANTIVITPTAPKATLYENNPLFGIEYEKPIPQNFSLQNPEIKIEAVPYFFNEKEALTFSWNMNGNPITSGQSPSGRSVVLRHNGEAGISLLTLAVKNINTLLQSADTGSSILLPKITGTNASSL